jgi:site-specific DNA-methyltransferase (adenine-specific)
VIEPVTATALVLADDVQALEPAPTLEGVPGILTRRSWLPPDDLRLDDWLWIGEQFQAVEESVMWWLGDWWRFGRRKYGEMASQGAKDHVQDITGHTYHTVRKAALVASRFEFDRRRSDIPFDHHHVVAVLEPEQQEQLLNEVKATGMTNQALRERVREVQAQNAAARRATLPVPRLERDDCQIEVGDARALQLDADTVDLLLGSPPYALEQPYGEGGDIDPASWFDFLRQCLAEAYRVAKPGGRYALNIPLDTTLGGNRPTHAQAVAAGLAVGWSYRSTVIWHDDQRGKSTARGSVDSAASPSIIAPVETIVLFYKGPVWGRDEEVSSDLRHDDWLEWTDGYWPLSGESQAWEEHPAPFPLELPRRLIHLLSFPGDLVVDQFVGSGTTALAALRAGRRFYGVDVEADYVASARRRVAQGVAA